MNSIDIILKQQIKKYWKEIIYLVGLLLISVLISVYIPLINGEFLNILTNDPTLSKILDFCKKAFIISVLGIIFNYIYSIRSVKIKNRFAFSLEMNFYDHYLMIDYLLYKNYDPTYLNKRTSEDCTTLTYFLFDSILPSTIKCIQIIIVLLILFRINVLIVLTSLIFTSLYILVFTFLKRNLEQTNLEYKEGADIFFSEVNEIYSLNKEIRLQSIKEAVISTVRSTFNNFLVAVINYTKISTIFYSLDSLLGTVFQLLVFLICGMLIISNRIDIGEYITINLYFGMLLNLIKHFFSLTHDYQNYIVSTKRLNDILKINISRNGSIKIKEIDSIELENVSFYVQKNYDERYYIIKNKNCKMKKGNIYQIIGNNGSGKSTLLNIITGIYNVNLSGHILYNGIDSKKIDFKYLKKEKISYLRYNEKLPNKSVKDYLLNYLEFSSINNIIRVMKDKEVYELIRNTSFNLEKILSQQISDLSSGQKQILIIMREIVKDKQVVIIDEALSPLDAEIREIVLNYFYKLRHKKIVIIVSHEKLNTDYIESFYDLELDLQHIF